MIVPPAAPLPSRDPGDPGLPLPDAAAVADLLGEALARRPRLILRSGGRRAAVLVLLYQRDATPHQVLTKRTETLATHRGQVCLPGGGWEHSDLGLRATALRETAEELGVPTGHVHVVGQLDDVHTMASAFVISPFVALLDRPFVPVPNVVEIARVMEVPLAELLAADDALPVEPAPLALRYPLLGEDVWGATARILRLFTHVLREALAGR